MESLYLLIPLSIVVLAASLAVFFWAVKSGQYEDLDGDGERILFDEEVGGERSAANEVANQAVAGAMPGDRASGMGRPVATDG